jgi:hypothetical protein
MWPYFFVGQEEAILGAKYCHIIVVFDRVVVHLPKEVRGLMHLSGWAAVTPL